MKIRNHFQSMILLVLISILVSNNLFAAAILKVCDNFIDHDKFSREVNTFLSDFGRVQQFSHGSGRFGTFKAESLYQRLGNSANLVCLFRSDSLLSEEKIKIIREKYSELLDKNVDETIKLLNGKISKLNLKDLKDLNYFIESLNSKIPNLLFLAGLNKLAEKLKFENNEFTVQKALNIFSDLKKVLKDREKLLLEFDEILKNNNIKTVYELSIFLDPIIHKDLLRIIRREGKNDNCGSIVWKMGAEGERELLAKKLAKDLGLFHYLVTKKRFNVDGLFPTGKPQQDVPGIASPFLENASEYGKSNFMESFNSFLKGASDGKDLLTQKESIQELLLLDIILQSSDSHKNQYMVTPNLKEVYNIDFARFLAPLLCYKSKDSGKTYCNFRSELLFHPASDIPIDGQLRSKIKSWNIDKMVKEYNDKNLILSGQSIDESKIKLEEIRKKINFVSNSDLTDQSDLLKINELCLEYEKNLEIDMKNYGSKYRTLCSVPNLSDVLRIEEVRLAKVAYSKIHKKAFNSMITRLKKIKDYVERKPNASVKDLLIISYPKLGKLLILMKEEFQNPGESIYHLSLETIRDQILKGSHSPEFKNKVTKLVKELTDENQDNGDELITAMNGWPESDW